MNWHLRSHLKTDDPLPKLKTSRSMNSKLEAKRKAAIAKLGDKWLGKSVNAGEFERRGRFEVVGRQG